MRTLYLLSVFIHVLAAMTWIGGMIVTAFAVVPSIRRLEPSARQLAMIGFMKRFGVVMWTAFLTAGVTGVLNLYFRGVRVADLLNPAWRAATPGHYIVAKIALFLLAGAVVSVHRRVHHLGWARWLGRLTLVIGVAIVLHALWLVRGA